MNVLLFLLLALPGSTGFPVRLMQACPEAPLQQRQLEFMGDSIELDIRLTGRLLLNGSTFDNRTIEEILKLVYRTQTQRTLLISAEPDVPYGRVLGVIDQVVKSRVVNKIVLLTPGQVRDLANPHCVMREE